MAQPAVQHDFNLALKSHQAGRLPEAERLYRQILGDHPRHVETLHYLGVLFKQTGRSDTAIEFIRQAIALRPDYAEAYSNLGSTLNALRRVDEAIAALRKAIELNPNLPGAYGNLGIALHAKGEIDQSIVAYQRALVLHPGYTEACFNLGNALKDKGSVDAAIVAYRRAIALHPKFAEALRNLANLLSDKQELDEAIVLLDKAIALQPAHPEAHFNLGNVLKDKGELDLAHASYRRAIALRPEYPEALSNLGIVLRDRAQLDEALAAFQQAVAIDATYHNAHSNFVYALHFHPAYDAKAIADEHRVWNERHAEPLRKFIQPHRNRRDLDRLLRVGYISPDFRDHVVGRNILPLLRYHDHGQFEITCYSQVQSPDELTRQFQQQAQRWRNIVGLSDEQVASQIRDDEIDILVDLTLHMANNRLLVLARKPAPVQVTFAGYPGSTGLSAIDYRMSDPYLDPTDMDESVYSEKTIRLPDSFWCYDPLDCHDIPTTPLPALEKKFITFGCVNNFGKINETVLRLWMQVLSKVDGSRLLLRVPSGEARQWVSHLMSRHGVDPQRVEFAPALHRRAYLQLYNRIDLALDTFPYNGHTTSLDSFWMGVPVVTLVGQTAVARAGWCQLCNLGLTELAAHSADQFVQIAVELAGNLPRLQSLRSTLRRRMEASPLMDAPRFTRNVESAYRQMWRDDPSRDHALTSPV